MQATSFGIKSTAQERPNAKIPRPGDVRCPGSGSSGHFSRCPYGTHTIAYPGSSAGRSPQGTVGHRRGVSTHRGTGIGDPLGGLPSSPAALRKASDAAGIATLRVPNRRTRQAVVWVPYVGFHPLACGRLSRAVRISPGEENRDCMICGTAWIAVRQYRGTHLCAGYRCG